MCKLSLLTPINYIFSESLFNIDSIFRICFHDIYHNRERQQIALFTVRKATDFNAAGGHQVEANSGQQTWRAPCLHRLTTASICLQGTWEKSLCFKSTEIISDAMENSTFQFYLGRPKHCIRPVRSDFIWVAPNQIRRIQLKRRIFHASNRMI